MADREKILNALYESVDELNPQLEPEQQLARSEETALAGDASSLDSLGFINLVLTAEAKVNEICDTPVNLAESLMEGDDVGPPETLGALADFIVALQET